VSEHLDVLVLGAGLSGIGAAARLTQEHPHRTYAVLESRAASGGTWDLFRYPGVRSDSDMFTLGYRWRPWTGTTALADGPSILDYVRDTAREYGVDRHVRYHHRVVAAAWDSGAARWTVTAETPDGPVELTCSFLWCCTGYYDYDQGYLPDLPGIEEYAGTVVHPQHWPEDLDHAGARVVVIGSGATAVTLVPAMAETAAHVTMLQRSPTYVVSLPREDKVAGLLGRLLPEHAAYTATRWKNILTATAFYQLSRRRPDFTRRLIRKATVAAVPALDVDTHFRPRYDPWDQRVCFVPDGDLFRALRHGDAEVVTDTIETFTPTGIRLASGRELEADVVVTATGLNLKPFGGIRLEVDGDEVKVAQTMAYRALMLSGVPNFAFTIGYTNASWTLKADLVADYVCRLLAHLDEHGLREVVPVRDDSLDEVPLMDFSAGYVLRSLDQLPVQGSRAPWRLRQNYLHDVRTIRKGAIDDGVLAFR
jgi:cation diffusion facilitator CzcD-associated flavoprotein CzcO